MTGLPSARPSLGSRAAGVLQLRPGEARMVAGLGALFLFAEAGRGLALNAADALFFLRFGVDNLPWMYMALGGLTILAVFGYSAALARFQLRSFLLVQCLATAAAVAAERAALGAGWTPLYPLLWLTVNLATILLWTSVWNIAGEVCDARQAKRLFSLFASASILGGVLGNFLTGVLASSLRTENLLLLYAGLTVGVAGLFHSQAEVLTRERETSSSARGSAGDLLGGLDYVRRSPFFRLVVAASVLFSVLFFSISYPFSRIVASTFPDEAAVAGFLGSFMGLVTSATFLVSLFFASRIYARIGFVNVVLLVPLFYVAAFLTWSLTLTLLSAAVVRFVQIVLINGLGSTAWNALYNVYPAERRSQLRAFESGVPMQLGVLLSGGFLLLAERARDAGEMFVLAAALAAGLGLLVWRMRAAYGQALVSALRSGIVDVYTATAGSLVDLAGDAQARRAARDGLGDERPSVRRLSAEVLGKLKVGEAAGELIAALADAAPEVRAAAVEALVMLQDARVAASIQARTQDPSPAVRAAAVRALSALNVNPAGWAQAPLADPDAAVRAAAAEAFHRAGDRGRARGALEGLLADARPEARATALRTLAACGIELLPGRLESCAQDPDARVRAATMEVMGRQGWSRGLFAALEDPDERVRLAAARALQGSEDTLDGLVHILESGAGRAKDAALVALEGHGPEAREALVGWAVRQAPRLAALRADEVTLARSAEAGRTGAVRYLARLLSRRKRGVERRMLKTLALLGERRSLELIAEGVQRGGQETRAQALEALDTLADRRVARSLLPLLEGASNPQEAADVRALLGKLMQDEDRWARALAVRALADLFREDLGKLASRAAQDLDPIVRQASAGLEAMNGGAMGETSRTLNTMDRILFLQQVSVFEDLEPEDLYPIAEIAVERLFPVGEYLCREGELSDELYVIVDGKVKVLKEGDGSVRTIRTLETGEHVGELALLAEQPRSASVLADGVDVRALVIDGQAVQSILRDRPQVALAMLSTLAKRMSTQV